MLDGRRNRGRAEAWELEVAHQRVLREADVEIRMQAAAESRQDRLFGRAAAAHPGIAFEPADLKPAAGHVGCEREAVVTGPYNDAVEGCHDPPNSPFFCRTGGLALGTEFSTAHSQADERQRDAPVTF